MTARTRPLSIKLISHKQLRALKSEALRAARELRNETAGAVLLEAGSRAREAWERLDTALNDLDDFSAEIDMTEQRRIYEAELDAEAARQGDPIPKKGTP